MCFISLESFNFFPIRTNHFETHINKTLRSVCFFFTNLSNFEMKKKWIIIYCSIKIMSKLKIYKKKKKEEQTKANKLFLLSNKE